MRIIPPLALIIITGCIPKTNQPVSTEPPPRLVTVNAPDTAEATAFVDALLKVALVNFDSGSDAITYSTLHLHPDSTWNAAARLNLGLEYYDCTEKGDFVVPSVDSNNVGIVQLTMTSTDCPSRESGKSQRVQFTLSDDGFYSVSFR